MSPCQPATKRSLEKIPRVEANQKYDDELSRILDEASARVPQYLFRGYSPASGGNAKLNGETAITPLFFLGRNTEDHLLEDWRKQDLIKCLKDHFVTSRRGFETRFSSWTASFRSACTYGYNSNACFICVLDTHKLPDYVHLFYVPDLLPESPKWLSGDEFVAYGTVPGSAYRSVSYQSLVQHGIANFLQPVKTCVPQLEQTQNDMRLAKRIGLLYGDQYALPVATAVFCLCERNWADSVSEEDLGIITKVLANNPRSVIIPKHFAQERFINHQHFIYSDSYPEIQRWIDLLRALTIFSHGAEAVAGVGAAARKRDCRL